MASTTTQQGAATAAATTPATAAAGAPAATAAAAPVSAQSSASLYVGDLDPQVTEALLFEIFNPIGPVASIRVCRDSTTRRSLGYAYVNFHMMVDAERALDTLNYQAIRGRACRIMWSHRDPAIRKSGVGNIFIKNLDKAIDHKALYDTFSAFGNILSCKVQTDDQGNSLGYGFVHYETAEAAEEAINRVNGMLLNEKKVFVGPFKSRKERPDAAAGKFTNCYVKNIPLEWDEDKFKEVFGECGEVRSLVIMKDADDNSRGFGFVDFSEPEQAQEAIAKYNDTVPEGAEKSMYVSRAQKRSERDQFLRRRFEQIRQERVSKYQGVNLYVKNLADDLNDDELRAAFAEYGTITSAKIMVDDKQNSKGFGFVCFTTPEEATLAVTEKNGKMVKGKPIYVALAQRKEVRRAQLEAQHAQRSRAPMVYQAPPYFAGPGGMQARQPFVYANPQNPRQMMAAPRWVNPAQGGGRGAYQAYPQQMRGGGRGGRGGGSGRGRGRGGQAISYTDAARNQGRMPVPAQQQAQPAQQPAKQGGGAEPLTTNRLASASPEHQKQILGERLYPLIAQQQPELAGKITGMLLEMDNAELLHLIESRDALNEKVNEAVAVLAAHAQAAAEAEAANQVFLLH